MLELCPTAQMLTCELTFALSANVLFSILLTGCHSCRRRLDLLVQSEAAVKIRWSTQETGHRNRFSFGLHNLDSGAALCQEMLVR